MREMRQRINGECRAKACKWLARMYRGRYDYGDSRALCGGETNSVISRVTYSA